MTQEITPSSSNEAELLGKAEYFVELHTPHDWSSGPTDYTWDPEDRSGGRPFASLEEAKAFAEKKHNPTWAEGSVEASYGVRYVTKLDARPEWFRRQQEAEAAKSQLES